MADDEQIGVTSRMYRDPAHTQTKKSPQGTPWDVRLGLTLIPARYVFRSYFKSIFDSAAPQFVKKLTGADWLRKDVVGKRVVGDVNQILNHFADHHLHDIFPNGVPADNEVIIQALNNSKHGTRLIADVEKKLNFWDARGITNNTVQWYLREGLKKRAMTTDSMQRIFSAMREPLFEMTYDTAFGAGSLAYTYYVQRNIRQDIINVYSEAVAYEKNKDPAIVTVDDIKDSHNEIIKSTIRNYDNKQWKRYAISALPFLKLIKPVQALQWAEMSIGAWGAMWAFDVWGREPTMLESFTSFINDKLNPLYGISDPIQPADIINIYQLYASRFDPGRGFTSMAVNDEHSNRIWSQSEPVFVRLAELMNNTYNFKHKADIDPQTGTPLAKANFALPKFIFLLGHGLIDARKPQWTMAYVEIANTYGMEAVKEVQRAQMANTELKTVLEKYPVDLNPRLPSAVKANEAMMATPQSTQEQKEAAQPAPLIADTPEKPDVHISAAKLSQDRLGRVVANKAEIAAPA